MAAEGGTSGKNSSTDQRQIQLTTGTTGANSPNLTATEGSKLGTADTTAGRDIYTTDFGAVDRAFSFAEEISNGVGQIFAGQSDATKATVQGNTAFLNGVLDKFTEDSASGQASATNKTLMYVALGGLVLVGLIFFSKR